MTNTLIIFVSKLFLLFVKLVPVLFFINHVSSYCVRLNPKPDQNLEVHHSPDDWIEWISPTSTPKIALISCHKYFEFMDEYKYNGSQLTLTCTNNKWSGPRGEDFDQLRCQIKCGTPVRDDDLFLTNGTQLDWPWHVGIFRNNAHICSGSLIASPRGTEILVLTAAHCIGRHQWSTPEIFKIVIGEVGLRIQDSDIQNAANQDDYDSLQIFNVSQITINPELNYSANGPRLNDIALLATVEPIKPTDYSIPVCLPSSGLPDEDEKSSQSGMITVFELGEGTINGGGSPLIKYRAINVQRLTTKDCNKISTTELSASQFCAGNAISDRRPCSFEGLGFGIMFQVPRGDENSKRYMIQGVENGKVGTSRSCIHSYTKVHSHIGWINSQSEELLPRKPRISKPTTLRPPTDSVTTSFAVWPEPNSTVKAPPATIPINVVENLAVPISVIVVVLILTIGTTCLCWRIYLHRQVKISNIEFNEFINGHRSVAGHRSNSFDGDTMPYEQEYEIKESELEIDQGNVLGYGTYGVVFKGSYRGEPVAVKTLKAGAEKEYLMALLSELKIMIYLKKHINLVSLVGAHTKFVQRGILHIVVDLCENGSLTMYLRKHRESFEADSMQGIQTRESSTGACAAASSTGSDPPLTTHYLLMWAYQISSAMEYLESKKVVHADLAARNVLLTENLIAKLSDFGLSRKLYEHLEYVKKHKEPMPWKWMAPESLQMLQFSSQSDVWSFGVTIWEMFTLGDNPYPGLSYSVDFPMRLLEGLRLYKPPYASNQLFELMQRCWNQSPQNRPTFQVIKTLMLDVLNTDFNLEEYTQLEFCSSTTPIST